MDDYVDQPKNAFGFVKLFFGDVEGGRVVARSKNKRPKEKTTDFIMCAVGFYKVWPRIQL